LGPNSRYFSPKRQKFRPLSYYSPPGLYIRALNLGLPFFLGPSGDFFPLTGAPGRAIPLYTAVFFNTVEITLLAKRGVPLLKGPFFRDPFGIPLYFGGDTIMESNNTG